MHAFDDSKSSAHQVESLPFAPGDVTAGTENELQAVVIGKRTAVDLPVTIERSKYYANIVRRVAFGEASTDLVRDLESFLSHSRDNVWENSWVRFPRKYLSQYASEMLDRDIGLSPTAQSEPRVDSRKFVFWTTWGEWIRVPISYLVKLSLADVIGKQLDLSAEVKATAHSLLPHFSNDLTSPETFSFHVIHSDGYSRLGKAVAAEMARRFLLTHLLAEWANKVLNLEALGQRAVINFAPHPAVRQRELNDCVSDAFYRELFVSPCLSGWTDGEAKHLYMKLAHQIVSRSQINAVAKLREAGILTNNLVVLPNTSSVSMGNNGTHLTLGSEKLRELLSDPCSGFTTHDAKRIGDLVIKISEHFLPLFVGTYTAAPYRLGFSDLHPERALGFLPHELDYTHLRMLWRHWKRKAHPRFFGRPISPCGPKWIDSLLERLFGARGDLVPDYRLIDFPVAWLCTESASALDGESDNTGRLKADLENMGVSDRNLKLYLPISLREFHTMGFFGFEGRYYSLFESMSEDFAPAADLQHLITLMAYKYVVTGKYAHSHIADDPSSESERRLPFFCAALGLGAFNARVQTPNLLLRQVVGRCKNSTSSRHGGYVRVQMQQYCLALLDTLEQDGADCIELLGLESTIADLRERLRNPDLTAYGKLTFGILGRLGKSNALNVESREFNLTAEQFYRVELKQRHLREALDSLRLSVEQFAKANPEKIRSMFSEVRPAHFLNQIEGPLIDDKLTPKQIQTLIELILVVINWETDDASGARSKISTRRVQTSIHRPVHAAAAR